MLMTICSVVFWYCFVLFVASELRSPPTHLNKKLKEAQDNLERIRQRRYTRAIND
jgi:hypothetical protein